MRDIWYILYKCPHFKKIYIINIERTLTFSYGVFCFDKRFVEKIWHCADDVQMLCFISPLPKKTLLSFESSVCVSWRKLSAKHLKWEVALNRLNLSIDSKLKRVTHVGFSKEGWLEQTLADFTPVLWQTSKSQPLNDLLTEFFSSRFCCRIRAFAYSMRFHLPSNTDTP